MHPDGELFVAVSSKETVAHSDDFAFRTNYMLVSSDDGDTQGTTGTEFDCSLHQCLTTALNSPPLIVRCRF